MELLPCAGPSLIQRGPAFDFVANSATFRLVAAHLRPKAAIKHAVLDCFGNVFGLNSLLTLEIGHGSSNL